MGVDPRRDGAGPARPAPRSGRARTSRTCACRRTGRRATTASAATPSWTATAGVRVVDWRWAPIAALFYRYREGEEFEEPFPGRVSRGVVAVRRVVVVDRGGLARIAADGVALARGPGGALAGGARRGRRPRGRRGDGGARGRARDGRGRSRSRRGARGDGAPRPRPVRRGLRAAGHARSSSSAAPAAARPRSRSTASPGSPSTTRAASRRRASRWSCPRPASRGSRRGCSSRSASIGRRSAPSTRGRAAPSRARSASRRRGSREETPPLVARLKRHPALYEALRRRPRLATARPGLRRAPAGARRSASSTGPSSRRWSRGRRAASPRPPSRRRCGTRGSSSPRRPRTCRASTPTGARRSTAGRSTRTRRRRSSGTLDLEDLPILLFLAARAGAGAGRRIAHLVVDEAEDVSLFELSVLGRQLAGRERHRRRRREPADASRPTPAGRRRSPRSASSAPGRCGSRRPTAARGPIAEVAHAVLGPLAPKVPPRAGRDGAPVSRFDFPTEAHAHLFLAGAIRDLLEREPRASVAVVAHAPEVARLAPPAPRGPARGAARARRPRSPSARAWT